MLSRILIVLFILAIYSLLLNDWWEEKKAELEVAKFEEIKFPKASQFQVEYNSDSTQILISIVK